MSWSFRQSRLVRVAIALTGASVMAEGGLSADRLALWKITNEQCVVREVERGRPEPCLTVQLRAQPELGFVVLKDLVGKGQVLVIPTGQISGIESSDVLKPAAGKLWLAAWHARHFIAGLLDTELSDDSIALAINSRHSRSQDQLHIHVDCINRDVRELLHDHVSEIGSKWTNLGFPLIGKHYRAIRLRQSDLSQSNLFVLAAESSPEAAADMAAETIIVTGATFPDGASDLIVLEDRTDRVLGDLAHGEDLLDHNCKVAEPR